MVAATVAISTAEPATKPKMTFVGDSVPAAITYSAGARATLSRGVTATLDLRVCRRLVQPSCSYQGSTPTTALKAVLGYGRGIGDVLIVDVGYNESAHGYGAGIDRIMRAARQQGVEGVVWVTLRATRRTYYWTNVAIRRAHKRWPDLLVADWNHHSAGKPWFGSDGLHLTAAGATALAAFLHPYVLQAARGSG